MLELEHNAQPRGLNRRWIGGGRHFLSVEDLFALSAARLPYQRAREVGRDRDGRSLLLRPVGGWAEKRGLCDFRDWWWLISLPEAARPS